MVFMFLRQQSNKNLHGTITAAAIVDKALSVTHILRFPVRRFGQQPYQMSQTIFLDFQTIYKPETMISTFSD